MSDEPSIPINQTINETTIPQNMNEVDSFSSTSNLKSDIAGAPPSAPDVSLNQITKTASPSNILDRTDANPVLPASALPPLPLNADKTNTPFLMPQDVLKTPDLPSSTIAQAQTAESFFLKDPGQNKGRVRKIITVAVVMLVSLFILGVGGASATYRFAPSIFFAYAPLEYAVKINSFWPLHHNFSDMLPADTLMYGTLNYGEDSDQAKKFKTLLTRIPGFAEAGNGFAKEADDFLKSEYNITLTNDITPAFGDTIYFAATSVSQNTPVFSAAVKIDNVAKAQSLMRKIEQSTNDTKLISRKENYNGVEIIILSSPQIDSPLGDSMLQTYNSLPKLFKSSDVAKTASTKCKGGLFSVCADNNDLNSLESGITSNNSDDGPSVVVMDNFLIISSSLKDAKALVDFNHARKPALSTEKSFTQVNPEINPSLASFYVNLDQQKNSFKDSFSDGISKTIYQGFIAWSGVFSAEDSGFQFKSATHFDPKGLNNLVAKIMTSPETSATLAKKHPSSTAMFAEAGELGSYINLLAGFDNELGITEPANATINDSFKTAYGVKLSDLGDLITGRFSIGYLPQQKSGVVLMTTVSDGLKMTDLLEQIKNHLIADSTLGLQAKSESVGSTSITTYTSTELADQAYNDYFSPAVAINGNTLIIATNPSAVRELLQISGETLVSDAQWALDQKITGTAGRVVFNLNNRRFYHGVIDTIREVTEDADLGQSDQETVIDAFLDVFPSISGATHNLPEVSNTIITIPVVVLDPVRKKEIEDLIKNDPSSIFSVAPFLGEVGVDSAYTPSELLRAQDARRKSDVQSIIKAVITANADQNDFKKYQTNGEEKLDPAQGVMKQMIDDGLLLQAYTDPDWPDYYYTMSNNGTSVKVTALIRDQNAPSVSDCEPKQIRDRWTWCVEQR